MNTRFFFPLALLASLAIHGGLVLSIPGSHSSAAAMAPKKAPQITRVAFMQVVKQEPDAPPKKNKPVQKSEQKETLPILAKKKLKPKSSVAKKKPIPEEHKIISPATEIAAVIAAKTVSKKLEIMPRELIQGTNFEEEKQRYLSTLLAHIEKHKYYPRPAQKRGIQGHVNVSFSLSPSGNISSIDVNGGPAVFQRAARKAVNAALPLPKPPESIEEALPVEYRMAFLLN